VSWFRQNDASKICVNVAPDNPAGLKFYAKHGAAPLKQSWMIWRDIRQDSLI